MSSQITPIQAHEARLLAKPITADGAEPFTLVAKLVNHRLSLWMSPSMVLRSAGSSRRRAWILPTACRTVV